MSARHSNVGSDWSSSNSVLTSNFGKCRPAAGSALHNWNMDDLWLDCISVSFFCTPCKK